MEMTYTAADFSLYPLLAASKMDITNRHPLSLRKMESLLALCQEKNIAVASPPFLAEKGKTSVLCYACPGCKSARETAISNVFEKLNIGRLPVCQKCSKVSRGAKTCGSIKTLGTPNTHTNMEVFPNLEKWNVNTVIFRKSSLAHMESVLATLVQKKIEPLSPVFTKVPPSNNSFVNYKCPDCEKPTRSMVSGFFKKFVFACHSCSAKAINTHHKKIGNSQIQSQIESKGYKVKSFEHTTKQNSAWTVECQYGHTITRPANTLLQDFHFCPSCNNMSIEQELMRALVETHYSAKFPTVRPNWMKSPATGVNLELDMFNADFGLAFEYHGPQHFKAIYGEERLTVSVRNDGYKRELCAKHGVKLIEIRYVDPNTSSEIAFLEKISDSLRLHGIPIDVAMPSKICGTIDFNRPFAAQMIAKAHVELEKQNKTLVACSYANSKSMLTSSCNACGHTKVQSIRALIYNKDVGKGCTVCSGRNKSLKNEKRYVAVSKSICQIEGWQFVAVHRDSAKTIVGFTYYLSAQAKGVNTVSKVSKKLLVKLMKKHDLTLAA